MPMIEKIVHTAKHTVKASVLMPSAMPRPSGTFSCIVGRFIECSPRLRRHADVAEPSRTALRGHLM
jgi:hypothetical protein